MIVEAKVAASVQLSAEAPGKEATARRSTASAIAAARMGGAR